MVRCAGISKTIQYHTGIVSNIASHIKRSESKKNKMTGDPPLLFCISKGNLTRVAYAKFHGIPRGLGGGGGGGGGGAQVQRGAVPTLRIS